MNRNTFPTEPLPQPLTSNFSTCSYIFYVSCFFLRNQISLILLQPKRISCHRITRTLVSSFYLYFRSCFEQTFRWWALPHRFKIPVLSLLVPTVPKDNFANSADIFLWLLSQLNLQFSTLGLARCKFLGLCSRWGFQRFWKNLQICALSNVKIVFVLCLFK